MTVVYLNIMRLKDANMAKLVKEECVCKHTMMRKMKVSVMKMMKVINVVT